MNKRGAQRAGRSASGQPPETAQPPCARDGLDLPFAPGEICRRLLAWYGREGRALPWRNTRDPYRVWLSEVMLQQTTVAAVIPYYTRFLERFPNLAALASAPLDEVISLWAGLGYYSRARNLHRTAQNIVDDQGGVFPDSLEALTALPGIGRSTAGAILSIAYDKPAPILDGNVRRVLVRLFAWSEDPRSGPAEKMLWSWAEALTPADAPHDYAQAIMDLGATVCTPRDPDCPSCPLRDFCRAFRNGSADALPVSRKQTKSPVRRQVALVVRGRQGVLLRQRPVEGFLGGLWEFPAADLPDGLAAEAAAVRLCADLGVRGVPVNICEIRHAYSHFKLELAVFSVEAETLGMTAEQSVCQWCPAEGLDQRPLHGAHRKILSRLAGSR